MRIPGVGDIAYTASASVTGLSYNTLYFVYYDDSTLAGGAVTVNASTSQSTAVGTTAGRFYLGSIQTPVAAAPDTTGNNDGGVGAQGGLTTKTTFQTASQTTSGNGAITNLNAAIQNATGSFTDLTVTGNGGVSSAHATYTGVPGLQGTNATVSFVIDIAIPTNTCPAGSSLLFKIGIYSDIAVSVLVASLLSITGGQTLARGLQRVTLPSYLSNYGQVSAFMSCQCDSLVPSGTIDIKIYRMWLEAV